MQLDIQEKRLPAKNSRIDLGLCATIVVCGIFRLLLFYDLGRFDVSGGTLKHPSEHFLSENFLLVFRLWPV